MDGSQKCTMTVKMYKVSKRKFHILYGFGGVRITGRINGWSNFHRKFNQQNESDYKIWDVPMYQDKVRVMQVILF